MAEAGGICISGSAFEQIENKLPLHYDYLGEHEVKNITSADSGLPRVDGQWSCERGEQGLRRRARAEAGRLWDGRCFGCYFRRGTVAICPAPHFSNFSGVEKADPQKMAFPLPDKPSIAVLPFTNLSDDKEQEYFADG